MCGATSELGHKRTLHLILANWLLVKILATPTPQKKMLVGAKGKWEIYTQGGMASV